MSFSDAKEAIAFYNQINNFGKDNGMELEMIEPGNVIYRMKVLERHLSSPQTSHGGIIAGLMDSVLGTSALSMAFTENNLVATVEFKMNFFRPALLGDLLVGEGRIEYKGKSLISTSADIWCKERDVLIAKGLGTFNVYPASKRNFLKEE